jgi:hypothetical protein
MNRLSPGLAPGTLIRQILGVRWIGLVLCVCVGTGVASATPRASNPAFLGIQMQDVTGRGPCRIDGATRNSPAEAAGLRNGDVVLAVDDKPIADCAVLLDEITGHQPTDAVRIKLVRPGILRPLVVQVQLTTRDALLRRMIGKPMVATHLVGVADGEIYDLSALHGTLAIVGLYNPACVDCGQLFNKFLEWSRARPRRGRAPILVLAATATEWVRDLRPELLQRSLDVPLATGELGLSAEDTVFTRELVISDRDRLGVLVIDARGTVQFAGPIAPNSDDTEAVLDELFAAVVQAQLRSM